MEEKQEYRLQFRLSVKITKIAPFIKDDKWIITHITHESDAEKIAEYLLKSKDPDLFEVGESIRYLLNNFDLELGKGLRLGVPPK